MRFVLLGDLCDMQSGGTPRRGSSNFYGGKIPWAKIGDLASHEGVVRETEEQITPEGLEAIGGRIFPPGTLLLAMYGSVGKTAIAGCEMSANQAILGIRPRSESQLDCSFLRRWLNYIQPALVAKARGVAQANISKSIVEHLEIPLAPIGTQRKISAILDKADAIRRKRQETIALTEQFIRSTFLEMFGDPVTNPKCWPEVTIGDVASVRTGKTPSRDIPENYGGTVPWVKTTEVRGGVIYDSEEHLSSVGLKGMEIFPEGSILIAMYGQGATRGRVAVLGVQAATNQACAALLPGPLVDRNFLWTYLQLSYGALREISRGGNQLNLNLSLVRSFPLPLPPLLLQQKFAAVRSRIDALAQKSIGAAHLSDSLFKSLVQRAFSGQI